MADQPFKLKPLTEILAPSPPKMRNQVRWRGRRGELKPMWAILDSRPPAEWVPPSGPPTPLEAQAPESRSTHSTLPSPQNQLDQSAADRRQSGSWWNFPANFQKAIDIGKEESRKRPGSHNDLGDAMRHAEWMRRTRQQTNGFTAWLAGTGYEINNLLDGNPLNETVMDLHNNAEGRAAGAEDRPVNPAHLRTLPPGAPRYLPGLKRDRR